MPTKKPENRRKHPRIAVSVPAKVSPKSKPDQAFDAEVLDISEGGAFVHCVAPLAIGESVLVEIRFGESRFLEGEVISSKARLQDSSITINEASVVRWARGSANSGFGIEFTGITVEKRKFLKEVVKYFSGLAKAGLNK